MLPYTIEKRLKQNNSRYQQQQEVAKPSSLLYSPQSSVYPKVTPTVFYCLPASSEAKYL